VATGAALAGALLAELGVGGGGAGVATGGAAREQPIARTHSAAPSEIRLALHRMASRG
jgi:hypothetical protein